MSIRIFALVMGFALLAMTSVATAKDEPRLGVYLGAGCGAVKEMRGFSEWLGREPDVAIEFLSWQVFSKGTTWGVRCWRNAGRKNTVFSLPMLPDGNTAKLAEGAAGKYDALFRTYAEHLVKNGFGSTVVRPGWEFNADWYPWAAKRDPKSFIAYWRRIVTTMRSVPGADFKFDWCAAGGWTAFNPEDAYPGDEYVDIIGLDFYNVLGNAPRDVTPQQRWEIRRKAPRGLEWHKRFATERSKPMSYPEWGTPKTKDGHGGDDDPYFVEQMAAWIKSNNVVYHNYWDFSAPILDSKLSNGRRPAAGAAFQRAFGGKHGDRPIGKPAPDVTP